jgi:3-oxoacyl-(acyl-carrier-protein) synthase
MQEKRIVITGIGPLTSIGIGKDSLWNALVKGKTNVKLEKWYVNGELWEEFYLHKIDNFHIKDFDIDKDALEEIRRWKEGEEVMDLYYLMAAVKLALEDSKLEYNPEDNDVGCVIAHENTGLEQYISKCIKLSFNEVERRNDTITKKQFSERYHYGTIKSAYDLQTFMVMFHILRTFKIHGYSLFVNNACASGLYALETASQMIKTGRCPVVIIAAADYPRIYKYLWFKDLNMYAQDGKIKPFSKEANGFIFGDGGVGLVMEDLDHAIKRKVKIYAEYLGGGFSQEGWKVVYPAVGSNFYPKAIKEAIEFSKIDKKDIDLVCAHGAANPIIDRYEAKAITDVFGTKPKKPLITTFKPYIGHNLGGSALLETAILLLCMENNLVLPVLNIKKVDPKMNIEVVKEKVKKEIKVALKICCAFAGYNAAAVFKKIKL